MTVLFLEIRVNLTSGNPRALDQGPWFSVSSKGPGPGCIHSEALVHFLVRGSANFPLLSLSTFFFFTFYSLSPPLFSL